MHQFNLRTFSAHSLTFKFAIGFLFFSATLVTFSKAQAQPKDIVVLGSSTAAGTGPTNLKFAWVNRFRTYVQKHFPTATVRNLAIGGYTTFHIRPTDSTPPPGRFAPDPNANITKALSLSPTMIIINLPSNDAANGFTVAEQLESYDMVLSAANAANVPVYISTTQPRNLSANGRRNLTAMRDSTFSRYGGNAIDFWSGLALENGGLREIYDSGDGIHLNNAGHAILFRRAVYGTIGAVGGGEDIRSKEVTN